MRRLSERAWPLTQLLARGGVLWFQVTGRCEWRHNLKPKKIPWAWSKTQNNPLDQNENQKIPYWNLERCKYLERINDNNAERLLFEWSCLFIYHTIAINFPRFSSHSHKLPEKYLSKFSYPNKPRNPKFQTQKNHLHLPVTWNPESPTPLPRLLAFQFLDFVHILGEKGDKAQFPF